MARRTINRSKSVCGAAKATFTTKLTDLVAGIDELNVENPPKVFRDLPISDETKKGLEESHFVEMTEIQRRSIPFGLKGRDILGSAETGSGKTLCFLIVVLEALYKAGWSQPDGLGALIISPTRELASQTFEVICKIGKHHNFSAGLIVGGNDLTTEKGRLSRINILVATPGRLLQHMDQTLGFSVDNLQILVLDEADRILELDFEKTLQAILSNLPRNRNTILFSATQTTNIDILARLSLRDPLYVDVKEETATPKHLDQYYTFVDLANKLNVLFGFIRTHLKSKALVFLTSCKQVRFVFETFRKLQPGVVLMHIHGNQKQKTRFEVSAKFSAAKHAFLFCTDVVARGLDFAAVDWVIQVDIPESAQMYIHRVGRTARFNRKGRALLFLSESESVFLCRLEESNVPIRKIEIEKSKAVDLQEKFQHMAFKDAEIKYLAQKSCISYLRSVYLQHDKQVFKFSDIDKTRFANSLGIAGVPMMKFQEKKPKFAKDIDDVLTHNIEPSLEIFEPAETGNEFMELKRADHNLSDNEEKALTIAKAYLADPLVNPQSKRRKVIAQSKKKLLKYRPNAERIVFDELGEPQPLLGLQDESSFTIKSIDTLRQEFVDRERQELAKNEELDTKDLKAKRKEKKKRRITLENIENDTLMQQTTKLEDQERLALQLIGAK